VLAHEQRVLGDADHHMQVTARAATAARLTFAGDAHGLAVVNARGDLHRQHAFARLAAAAAAVAARIGDHLARPATRGAGRDHAEHPAEAGLGDLALSGAGDAGDRLAAGRRAAALAGFAGVLPGELDFPLDAGRDVFQRNLHLGFEAVSPRRPGTAP